MKVMVVTGASSGVGRATAQHFAEAGYEVCAIARSEQRLEELAATDSGHIYAYPGDVTDSAQVEDIFRRIGTDWARVDVLVNNAGVTAARQATSSQLIDQVVDTNLKGPMYCTFAALPWMRQAGSGNIVNIASIAGADILPRGSDGLYGASKHGLVAFSELIGKKYRGEDVLVTALCPGGIDTELWNEQNPYPFEKTEMIRPHEVAELIDYIIAQPRRTVFKNVVFVPVVEEW